MASGRKPVSDKVGREFLQELADNKDAAGLETLWRAEQPELRLKLVVPMAASGDELLGHLLVDTFFHRAGTDEVVATVRRSALGAKLSQDDTAKLIGHVQSAQAASLTARPAAQWVMAQTHRAAGEFARDFILGQVTIPGADDSTYMHAYKRTGSDRGLADQVAAHLAAALDKRNDASAWLRAARFLDQAPRERHSTAIEALLRLVAERSNLGDQLPGPTLRARLAAEPQLLLSAFEGSNVRASEAANGLVDAIADIEDPADRGRVGAALVLRHPSLSIRTEQAARRWSEEEWAVRLDGLLAYPSMRAPASLAKLLDQAPQGFAPKLMTIAGRHRNPVAPQIQDTAVSKSLAALNAAEDPAEQARRLAWPQTRDDSVLPITHAVLKAVPSERRGLLLAHAVAQGLVPVEVAPTVVEPSDYGFALLAPPLSDGVLTELAGLLWDAAPDHMTNVLRKRQQASFSLPIAEALAPRNNGAAFTGAAGALRSLSADERDHLIALLEAHAGWSEQAVFAAIADDTTGPNAARRGRVLAIVGRVAPTGMPAPDYLRDAIRSSNAGVVGPAFAAIGSIAPADAQIVHDLRSVASRPDGPNAAKAATALDTLTSSYLARLAEVVGDRAAEVPLLRALGATARREAIDRLLEFLGPDALDDRPEVKQVAAQALQDGLGAAVATSPQMERLGQLLDGDAREADPLARQSLESTLAGASLGEDAALAVVYELAGIPLPRKPDLDLGQERRGLLRHATLYKSAESLGQSGWPAAISHLDHMAMFLGRAAYRAVGTNVGTKAQLARGNQDLPKWGALIDQFQGPLDDARGPLETLHQLRSSDTELAHPGNAPTADTVATARTCFQKGARVLLTHLRPH